MKTINTLLIYCLVSLGVLLPGCGSDTELPPERPVGTVAGKVFDSAISGAQITVYAFGDGIRGARLGGTTTDAFGDYSVEIQSKDQLILIEATGGSYIEQATETAVTIPSGQALQAIVDFQSGATIEVVVTPLTHLVSGLTSFKVDNGTPAMQAFTEARSTIDQYFTIDTAAVIPIDITDNSNSVSALSSEALYGFYLAGISNWSLWASNKNQVTPHTIYTSIGITQIMYNDIQSDGALDGVGYDLNRENLMPLAIGVVPLNTESYRAAFSLHMLAISNVANNATNLKPADLQVVAEDLANKSSALFTDTTPLDISNQAPALNPLQPLQTAYSGTMTLQFNIGGYLGAETISVSIDGSFIGELQNPQNPLFIIDTTDFAPDGDHTLSFSATDVLGNIATQDFTVSFDNTNPVVNVTSSAITNTTPSTISGSYSDNVSGVNTILVNGQPASLDQNGNWNVSVEISPGENIIPINVLDNAGNQTNNQTTLYLDVISPVIDTSIGHSDARFSDGSGGFFTAPLQDSNDATALYLETNRLELNGVSIIRQELDNNLIPYFSFTVSDELATSIPTDFSNIDIRIQYEKNKEILSPWHVLPAPAGNEYLIPLASETLALDWHQATQFETHTILLEVRDPAGNITSSSFSFRTDFYVPSLDINSLTVTDLGSSIFSTTVFDDRATLNDMQFDSVAYETVLNPVNQSIYIRPEDGATHTIDQIVEQLVREHHVRLITSTEWRIGLMTPTIPQQCPDVDPPSWQPAPSVYNWTQSEWIEIFPQQIAGPIENQFDDNPNPPSPSEWYDKPLQNDQDFKIAPPVQVSAILTLHYKFDYVLNPSNLFAPAASVSEWQLRNNDNVIVAECPDSSFFQQRETFSYASEDGYPNNVINEVALSNLPGFSTTGFTVFDNDANEIIQAINGWYQIPAGHSFTITKLVTTPQLVNHNEDISDITSATYTPKLNDKSISWSVNREISVSVIHDAGESRISDMSQTIDMMGSGALIYQIAR